MENSINNKNLILFLLKMIMINILQFIQKSDNIEIMISDVTDEIIEKLFNSLKNRYQNNFQSMRSSEFVFDYVQLLYHRYHKVNLNRGKLYIDYPD